MLRIPPEQFKICNFSKKVPVYSCHFRISLMLTVYIRIFQYHLKFIYKKITKKYLYDWVIEAVKKYQQKIK